MSHSQKLVSHIYREVGQLKQGLPLKPYISCRALRVSVIAITTKRSGEGQFLSKRKESYLASLPPELTHPVRPSFPSNRLKYLNTKYNLKVFIMYIILPLKF